MTLTAQKVGYAQVSTKEQDLSLQLDALAKFDRNRVFTDKFSSIKQRQGLQETLNYLREGDSVIPW